MASDYEDMRIQAECADCGFIFNLCFGTDCPRCHHTGVVWARLVSKQEYEQNYHLYGTIAGKVLRKRLDEWAQEESVLKYTGRPPFRVTETNWTLTEGEKLDVAELYRMAALEDKRTVSEPIG